MRGGGKEGGREGVCYKILIANEQAVRKSWTINFDHNQPYVRV